MNKSREYATQKQLLVKSLAEKSEELEELRGRLEESREAREATLQEMNSARKRYSKVIKDLKEKLEETYAQLECLQKTQGDREMLETKIGLLEAQLEETIKLNDDLAHKVEVLQDQQAEKRDKVSELESTIERLQKSLHDVEEEKEELYTMTQKLLKKCKSLEKADTSALILLKEQLIQSKEKYDETKESLFTERQKTKELSNQLEELDKAFGLVKVDIRILTREKSSLETQLANKLRESQNIIQELELAKASQTEMEKRVAEIEKLNSELQAKNTDYEFDLIHDKQVLDETKEDKRRLEENLKELRTDINKLQESIQGYENLKLQLDERDKLLRKSNEMLLENEMKIDSLKTNVSVLREASSVLDIQLKDFEVIFNSKLEELEKSEFARAELLAELSSMKETTQKTKISLNEAISLKLFLEKQLSELESQFSEFETQKQDSIKCLTDQVEELKEKNAQLVQSTNKMAAEMENLVAEKGHLEERCERVNKDNAKYIHEVHHYIQMIVDFKDNDMKMKEALEQALLETESYKIQLGNISDELKAVQMEKTELDIQQQSTISQQAKLIDYLQSQNEALVAKKKDKKFHLFSTPSSTKKNNTEPLYDETPGRKCPLLSTPRQLVLSKIERDMSPVDLMESPESATSITSSDI